LDGLVVELADQYMRTGPMLAAARARMTASDDIRLVYRARHDRAVDVFLTFLRRIHRVGLVDVEDVSATAVAAVVLVQALNHPALAEDTQGYIRTGVQRALRALILGTP
jgi:hypothetical protein